MVILGEKRVDLKALGEQVGSRLSFASDKRLEKYLNLAQGEVSPLASFTTKTMRCMCALQGRKNLGVHPCDNAATVVLSFDDILRLVEILGNPLQTIEMENNK